MTRAEMWEALREALNAAYFGEYNLDTLESFAAGRLAASEPALIAFAQETAHCATEALRLVDALAGVEEAVAAERERCAKVAEGSMQIASDYHDPYNVGIEHGYAEAASSIAAAIRQGGRDV